MAKALPRIEAGGHIFRKVGNVLARPARPGERVVTTTADGFETCNSAERESMLVRNQTDAEEHYLVELERFHERYARLEDRAGGWSLYAPTGDILALEVSAGLLQDLGASDPFWIDAPWNSPQRVRQGDMLATALPEKAGIYRVSRKEFGETYRPVTGPA